MPFASKRQQRAAFGGYIPGFTKEKAKEWADETDFSRLPERAPSQKGKPTLRSKQAAVPALNALRRAAARKAVRSATQTTQSAEYTKTKQAHFTKIADLLMGMGNGAGQLGGRSSSTENKPPWAVPPKVDVPEVKPRGPGDYTPPRPKKPGADIKKQAVNPRRNLRDAMTFGVA